MNAGQPSPKPHSSPVRSGRSATETTSTRPVWVSRTWRSIGFQLRVVVRAGLRAPGEAVRIVQVGRVRQQVGMCPGGVPALGAALLGEHLPEAGGGAQPPRA